MKAVVSFSGGMDSATVLAKAMNEGREVVPVGFKYGSQHNQWEYDAGHDFLVKLGFHPAKGGQLRDKGWRHTINLEGVFGHMNSNLLKHSGEEIPEGHYEAENMKLTVVPGRNIIFASVLAGFAWSIGAEEVWMGIHAGDHYIYPDCRPSFFMAMDDAIQAGTDGKVKLRAPFLDVTKKEILQEGLALGVDYSLTRTCYCDQPIACGRCGSCQERLSAFAALGIDDPIQYESRQLIPKD